MDFELTKDTTKKAEIINALFKCLYVNGVSGITMRQIALEADINLGSLHYYFKSKENLLMEFQEALFNRFIDDVKARYKDFDPPLKKLDAFFYGGRDFVLKQKELFVVLIDVWSFSIRNIQMQKSFSNLYDKLAGVMDEILVEGERAGVFNAIQKQTLSRLYVSFVEGTGLNCHMTKVGFDVEEQFSIMIERLKELIIKE